MRDPSACAARCTTAPRGPSQRTGLRRCARRSDQDIRDLSAYYAYLPRSTAREASRDGASPAAYVQGLLRAFASGERRNDAFGQMRNVARQLTEAEIGQIASYYASQREAEEPRTTVP